MIAFCSQTHASSCMRWCVFESRHVAALGSTALRTLLSPDGLGADKGNCETACHDQNGRGGWHTMLLP